MKNYLFSRNTHLLDQFYHKHSGMCINIEACLFQDYFFQAASGQWFSLEFKELNENRAEALDQL